MDQHQVLFSEFPGVSREEWDEKIIKDLKGAPYEKLIWKSPEGFNVKPYYLPEDLEGLEYLDNYPSGFPYNRSNKTQLNDWEIRENIYAGDIESANKKALQVLDRGASSLNFVFGDVSNMPYHDFLHLLKGIYYECIHINFTLSDGASTLLKHLDKITHEQNIPGDKIIGSLNLDPLAQLARGEAGIQKTRAMLEELAGLIPEFLVRFPFFRILSVNGSVFHNAGGNIVRQLAYSLSMVAEYLESFRLKGLSIDQTAPHFTFSLSTGSQYFLEIAGLRALRLLYANLIRSWKPEKERAERCFIHCTTSEWTQTVYDPYVNMLRGTTQAMSAAIGGADSITVIPFDRSFRETGKFSERIARNTQIILKEEAHLDKVVDPSAGAYYIESLTDSIAGQAWELFLETEKQGGFIKALEAGFIQKDIAGIADSKRSGIASAREVFTGTNRYANPDETLNEDFSPEIAFPEPAAKGDVEPLTAFRGAEEFEKLRMNVEHSPKRPVVFLLTYGDLTWRKARAGFAWGFFATAGYTLIDNNGFESIREGMEKAEEAGADIIVLCSKDDEYPVIFPEAVTHNKTGASLVIAGYPKDHLEELKKEGAQHFIHLKSNLLDELKTFNKILGIG